jgi:myo-inositol-1(or 4)-monophosphatase
MEATVSSSVADHAQALVDYAERFRIMGSLALSLCQLAAGRVDAVCSLRGARSVDVAAAQLLVREVGLSIGYVDTGAWEAGQLDLVPRAPVVAAATDELRDRLAGILAM